VVGSLFPLGIIYHPELSKDRNWIVGACALVIAGGFAAMYVIIIGSQAYPLEMFPGKTVLEFGAPGDIGGQVAPYAPSFPEILLGLGAVGVALLITAVGVRVLQFLPESLADQVVDSQVSNQSA
jgi:molybdopterin-containing oxidoreductase family membrane subunit